MGKVKRLTLDRYEHGLLVRALYEEWQRMQAERKPTEDIIKVIDSIEAAPYEIKHLDSYVRKALFNAVHDIRAPE